MSVVDMVLQVHERLQGTGRSHAFGGALALAYIAEPRGAVDVDVDLFAPVAELDECVTLSARRGRSCRSCPPKT